MDSFQEDSNWPPLIDYSAIIEDAASTDFYWSNQSSCMELDPSLSGVLTQEIGGTRKRSRNEASSKLGTKACREKMRRDKLNDRHASDCVVSLSFFSFGRKSLLLWQVCTCKLNVPFFISMAEIPVLLLCILMGKHLRSVVQKTDLVLFKMANSIFLQTSCPQHWLAMSADLLALRVYYLEWFSDLSSILEPGRPAKTDKSAILSDAIRVLNQLRTETQQLKESNEKLQEEIKSLKTEKNELREEKLLLKADKEKIEQQVKSMNVLPTGFVSPHPAAYPAGVNKMMAYPNYGGYPMWHWIPPTALDTSQDHVLRPPVA